MITGMRIETEPQSRKAMQRLLSALVMGVFCCGAALAAEQAPATSQFTLADGKTLILCDREEGARLILADAPQPFFSVLSPTDVSLRLEGTVNLEPSVEKLEKLKELCQASVEDWTADEADWLRQAAVAAHERCNEVLPDLVPQEWRFIKSPKCREETGLSGYTRGMSIILSGKTLRWLREAHWMEMTMTLIVHEAYHVYSRHHPEKREALYKILGFSRLPSLELDPDVARRRITNPDAPDCAWAYPLPQEDGTSVPAILLTVAPPDKDEAAGSSLLNRMEWGFYPVHEVDGRWRLVRQGDSFPRPIDPRDVSSLVERIDVLAEHTDMTHPEEIMAVLVARVIVEGGEGPFLAAPNRDLLRQVEKVLKAEKGPEEKEVKGSGPFSERVGKGPDPESERIPQTLP